MTPQISVVMGVYNGAGTLAATIESVRAQVRVDLELIIVDDGSTDATPIVAARYAARDNRVRVIHLRKVGLTRALVAGCDAARGAFIARQDCGDRSSPERLARQLSLIAGPPGAVLASVGTRFYGPAGETLYDVAQTSDTLRQGLAGDRAGRLRGPSHHGATMFRKSAYMAVGGYRDAFGVAQDLDLWTRLAEIGECVATPDVLYEASLSLGSISHVWRMEQMRASKAILDCAALRRRGASDEARVEAWRSEQNRHGQSKPASSVEAAFHYYVASMLRDRDPATAIDYYRKALRASFWAPKVWFRLAQLRFNKRKTPRIGVGLEERRVDG